MTLALTVIYDDRQPPPSEIDAIIGAARFSDVLRRRVSLGEEIRREVEEGGGDDLFHLVDTRDAIHLAEMIEASPANRIFMRLPSFLMPTRRGELAAAVRKARYALGSILLSPPLDGDAAALLVATDTLALLRASNPTTVREVILGLAQAVPIMMDHCGFTDLRRPDHFLRFLGGATESRYFNTTRVEGRILRKSSIDREKIKREYNLFHIVPESMKSFLVPTFDYRDDGALASYAMERLAIPDAAIQFIHGAFDESSFATLLDRFLDFAAARPAKPVGVAAVRVCAKETILGKMDERLEQFLGGSKGRHLDALLRSADSTGGLVDMQRRSRILIEAAIARDRSAELVVGHGDPCFSNILFDRRIGLLRLIDPRGALTLDEAWMHPLYDIAKFSHSILGGYDFVNSDLFDCHLDHDLHLQLSLHRGGPPAWCQALFTRRLEEHDLSYFVVRAYELSLFMSMLPMHQDHPRKLAGFVLIAHRIILELEGLQ